MYSLFNDPLVGGRGSPVTLPTYDYAIKGIRQDLRRVIQFNRRYPTAVRSNHFLVRLLQSLHVPFGKDVGIYRYKVMDVAEDLSMALRLTSSLYKGAVYSPGVFWGENSREILITHSGEWDISKIETEWENYEPIKFLRHPKTDLGLVVPNGRQNSDETGVSVILINIPMLACQYRMFRIREYYTNRESQRTPMQFVYSYPLTNALHSKLDIALFNRFMAVNEGDVLVPPFIKNSQPSKDWSGAIDPAFVRYQQFWDEHPRNFDEMLDIIDTPDGTFRSAIQIPNMLFSRQVTWALTIARLPYVKYLLKWDYIDGGSKNQMYRNTIKREVKALLGDSVLKGTLSKILYEQVVSELEEVLGYC